MLQIIFFPIYRPFKTKLAEIYDSWIAEELEIKPQFTKNGRMKNPEKKTMVDWVVQAFNSLSEELLAKSFVAVGQSLKSRPENITSLKPGNNFLTFFKENKKKVR